MIYGTDNRNKSKFKVSKTKLLLWDEYLITECESRQYEALVFKFTKSILDKAQNTSIREVISRINNFSNQIAVVCKLKKKNDDKSSDTKAGNLWLNVFVNGILFDLYLKGHVYSNIKHLMINIFSVSLFSAILWILSMMFSFSRV